MRRHKKNKILLLVLFLIFSMSVGFAALTTTLSINGTSKFKGNSWNIYFDNVQVKNGSVQATQTPTIPSDNKTQLNFGAALVTNGDYYELDVDIVNAGTLDAMIDSYEISPALTEEQQKYLEYRVEYSNGAQLNVKDLLAKNSSEKLNIRIAIKSGANTEDLPDDDTNFNPSIIINYVQATEDAKKPVGPPKLLATTINDKKAFRSDTYKQKIKTITFERGINVPANAVASWDIGVNQNGDVMAYVVSNTTDSSMYDLHIQSDDELYANEDMKYWFEKLEYVDSINGINLLNTSRTTDMSYMFHNCWTKATNDLILDLSSWDTSNVTSITHMFSGIGYNAKNVDLNLSNWDTTNVVNMNYMFAGEYDNAYSATYSIGAKANTFNLRGLDDWNTQNVISMAEMFFGIGEGATTWSIGDLSNWNTSSVTNMFAMFENAGYKSNTFDIGNLSNWDTSNVTTMTEMFYMAGYNAKTFNLEGIDNWNTGKVTSMSNMFTSAGYNATTFNLGNLGKWDVSNVTSMSRMFYLSGTYATTWNIGDLSNWNVSKVTNMSSTFSYAGFSASTFNIGNLSNWNTSNVTICQLCSNMQDLVHQQKLIQTYLDGM